MVCLIENQPAVWWQHRGFLPVVLGLADREIRRQEVMIDDHYICLRGPSPGSKQKAAVEVGALEAGAEIGLGADLVPDLRARSDRQVAQWAVGRMPGPLRNP